MTRIGILAFQGDFREHALAVERLGAESRLVRLPRDLEGVDGLILPGGESTVMGKLMIAYDVVEPLRSLLAEGMPAWGTCAGMILLSRATDNALAGQPLLASINMRTRRNAFGAQRESFETMLNVPAIGPEPYHAVFIRGPIVEEVGEGVEVLARIDAPEPNIVAVRQNRLLATAFHPEMTGDLRFHEYFLGMVRDARAATV
ncbi:MAG TPA: pyridoxal 5'-phosphate synthase glutaminase subunit PdxT [Ktedonobacterales bacterium]|nr:pyridoxal 5'-phosphate synthase glutaminase subunit PdxT [Ktedonobacterales bacterium]